jgi:hypothetical protein
MLEPNEKCWVCENYIYTVFFWSTSTGWATQDLDNGMEEEEIVQQVDDIHRRDNSNGTMNTFEVPHVCSIYSNWKPTPMLPLKNFCDAIDRKKPNFFNEMQAEGKIPQDIKSIDDSNLKKHHKRQIDTAE